MNALAPRAIVPVWIISCLLVGIQGTKGQVIHASFLLAFTSELLAMYRPRNGAAQSQSALFTQRAFGGHQTDPIRPVNRHKSQKKSCSCWLLLLLLPAHAHAQTSTRARIHARATLRKPFDNGVVESLSR